LNKNNIHFDESSVFDMFNNIFGQGSPFGQGVPFGNGSPFGQASQFSFGRQEQGQGQGSQPIQLIEEIKLSDVYSGKRISRTIERDSPCQVCKGTGSNDGEVRVCRLCHGRKMVQQQVKMGNMICVQPIQCPQCKGTGSDNFENACKTCSGTKCVKNQHAISFNIPIGQSENELIVIKSEGNKSSTQSPRGDIIIKVVILQDNEFKRNIAINGKKLSPTDLLLTITINVAETLCGFERKIMHVNGKEIVIAFSDVSKEGDIYSIDDGGLPNRNGEMGKLYVLLKVNTSQIITAEKRKLLWEALMTTPYMEKKTTNITRISF
jgi:DnaJ-class molecular chaperone